MKTKRILSFAIAFMLVFSTCGCGKNTPSQQKDSPENPITLNIAFQYGLSYAPLVVCKEKGLIEAEYEKRTGQKIIINWNQMNSGADINTAFASGNLDIACMGIAPAISGISNNIGYKIFTNISGQEHGLMANDSSINTLNDYVGSDKQIALVNIGSIQHIILGIALVENGLDAHALDSNIVAMKHPDGMFSIESGSISSHLTSNPYIYMERQNQNLHEIDEVKNAWSSDYSFIVGLASEKIYNSPELYSVICDSFSSAIDYINANPQDAANITYTFDGNTYEDELAYIQAGSYSTNTAGILKLAQFMYDNKFIDRELKDFNHLVYDNVQGD